MTIKRIAPLSTAKIAALVYIAISLPFAIFIFWLVSLAAPVRNSFSNGFPFTGLGFMEGTLMLIILPVIYGVVGFVMTLVGAWLYNVVAGWVGGIEIEVQTQP